MKLARLLGPLVLVLATLSGCLDQGDDGTPDPESAVAIDGKADGMASAPYLAMFSPGLLRSTRAQRMVKGISEATIGFHRGVGCHVMRQDSWKLHELVIPKDATFAVHAEDMTFLRFATGQVGFKMRLNEYPQDTTYPLVMYCWGFELSPDAIRDALLAGANDLRLEFTPSEE